MRTVMTTADGIPFRDISVQDAILKLLSGKAIAVENHPELAFHSQHMEIPVPLRIQSLRYVKLPNHFYGPAKLSNINLFTRDNHYCKYCGAEENLTRDHVVPLSRGGKDVWENVVTSCTKCNNRKGDRTPEEAGMRLNIVPKPPVKLELIRKKADRRLHKVRGKKKKGKGKRK